LIGTLLARSAPKRATEISFTRKAARALLRYTWPLNIRELEKCLEAAVVLAGNLPIRVEHLPEPVRSSVPRAEQAGADEPLSEEDHRRREELVALLNKHEGNLSAIAQAMGKDRAQIRRWLKRYQLEAQLFRPG
jgi:DNA-binding NtrC family response regulator